MARVSVCLTSIIGKLCPGTLQQLVDNSEDVDTRLLMMLGDSGMTGGASGGSSSSCLSPPHDAGPVLSAISSLVSLHLINQVGRQHHHRRLSVSP